MTPIQKIVETALLGGWRPGYKINLVDGGVVLLVNEERSYLAFLDSEVFLDRTFWQALHKALGWRTRIRFSDTFGDKKLNGWEYYWLSFTLHLAEGKEVENFFRDLLR